MGHHPTPQLSLLSMKEVSNKKTHTSVYQKYSRFEVIFEIIISNLEYYLEYCLCVPEIFEVIFEIIYISRIFLVHTDNIRGNIRDYNLEYYLESQISNITSDLKSRIFLVHTGEKTVTLGPDILGAHIKQSLSSF